MRVKVSCSNTLAQRSDFLLRMFLNKHQPLCTAKSSTPNRSEMCPFLALREKSVVFFSKSVPLQTSMLLKSITSCFWLWNGRKNTSYAYSMLYFWACHAKNIMFTARSPPANYSAASFLRISRVFSCPSVWRFFASGSGVIKLQDRFYGSCEVVLVIIFWWNWSHVKHGECSGFRCSLLQQRFAVRQRPRSLQEALVLYFVVILLFFFAKKSSLF